jgi:hypothetical protein
MENPFGESVALFADGFEVGVDDALLTGAVDIGAGVRATGAVVTGPEEGSSIGAGVTATGAVEIGPEEVPSIGATVTGTVEILNTGATELGEIDELLTMTGATDLPLTGTVARGVGALVTFNSESLGIAGDIAGAKIG